MVANKKNLDKGINSILELAHLESCPLYHSHQDWIINDGDGGHVD